MSALFNFYSLVLIILPVILINSIVYVGVVLKVFDSPLSGSFIVS